MIITIGREFGSGGRELGRRLSEILGILALMPAGGVLVSDNVLQDGEAALSRFALPRRSRTIHSRMREYLYELKHHEALETAILSVGDGVAVSVKRQ